MKTMKGISWIALFLIIGLAFAACEQPDSTHKLFATEPAYEVSVVDASDSAAGIAYQIESDVKRTKEKVDDSVPKTASLTINGQKIEGTYSHSEMVFPNNFYRHIYLAKDGKVEFFLDNSGRLLCFSGAEFFIENVGENERTEEECLTIAKEFIQDYFAKDLDLSKYTMEKTRVSATDYRFLFIRDVDGWKTSEQILIVINKDGSVQTFSTYMLDQISVDYVAFDKEKTLAVMNEKLDEIYAEAKTQWFAINYEDPNFVFTLLEGGKPAVYCTVTIRFETESGGSFGEMVSMIIT